MCRPDLKFAKCPRTFGGYCSNYANFLSFNEDSIIMCSKTSHQLAVLSLVWSNYLFRSKHSVYFPLPIIFSYQFNPNFPGGQIQALLKHRLEGFKKSYNRKGA